MATNIVLYVMQFLTPDMIGRIGTALRLNRSEAQAGVSTTVPALLAAFSGVAEKPGGAQNLVNAIKQQSGVLDNFAAMIGGSNQSSFTERGSNLLTSLLGSQDQSALAGAVGRFAGLGQSRATSMLGMLTPVAMGLIGRQIGARGVDVGSLTGLLASQREQIAQALPAGMGELLDRTGLGAGLGATAAEAGRATATDQVRRYPSSATGPTGTAAGRTARDVTAGVPNWAYWVLPLIVLGALLWYLLGRPSQHEQVTQQAPTPQTTAPRVTTPAPSVVVGGVDLKQQLSDSFSDLRNSLNGVTDPPSARAALPKLEGARTEIDKVSSLAEQLTPDQRKIVAGLVASAIPTINRLSDEVLKIPGVDEVLRPTLDPLKTKLAELSGQPTTVGAGR